MATEVLERPTKADRWKMVSVRPEAHAQLKALADKESLAMGDYLSSIIGKLAEGMQVDALPPGRVSLFDIKMELKTLTERVNELVAVYEFGPPGEAVIDRSTGKPAGRWGSAKADSEKVAEIRRQKEEAWRREFGSDEQVETELRAEAKKQRKKRK